MGTCLAMVGRAAAAPDGAQGFALSKSLQGMAALVFYDTVWILLYYYTTVPYYYTILYAPGATSRLSEAGDYTNHTAILYIKTPDPSTQVWLSEAVQLYDHTTILLHYYTI